MGGTIRSPIGGAGAVGTTIRQMGSFAAPLRQAAAAGPPVVIGSSGRSGSLYSPRVLGEYGVSSSVASTGGPDVMVGSSPGRGLSPGQRVREYAGMSNGSSASSAYDPNNILDVARQQYASDPSPRNTSGGGRGY